MNIVRPLYIEGFIISLVQHDGEIGKIIGDWEIERSEVWTLLIEHYLDMGLYTVHPLEQLAVFRRDLIYQLSHSPKIRKRRAQIRRDIAKVRERNRARTEEGGSV